ncbi:MAG: S9 family peptidase [Bacteroidetes bacterium]|nr:S9 family peptidase [Bacteroidota bacterium]
MKKHFDNLLIIGIMLISLVSQAKTKVMTAETLWEFGRVSDVRISPDGKTILFGITYFDIDANRGTRNLYTMPVSGGKPTQITNTTINEFNALWRPDGKKIGFLSSESGSVQLWEMNIDGTNRVKVSDIPGGISGFNYSPDMKNIVFFKNVIVLPGVKDLYPDLPKANARIYDDLMFRHWDHWTDNSFNHVFIASYNNSVVGDYYDIMEGEPYNSPLKPYGGMDQIIWSPDGQKLLYTSKKLFGKDYAVSTNSDLYLYDVKSKDTKNITEFNKGYDKNPAFSPDGKFVAWESMETDGFESDKTRIMILDLAKGTYKDYTKEFDQSSSGFVWSAKSDFLYFISGVKATHQIYSLEIKTGKIKQLTQGRHDYTSINLAGSSLVATQMTMAMPVEIFRIDIKTTSQTQISFVNKEILDNLKLAKIEERWVKTTDNKDMLVWVIYPPDFDPAKKYPALLYCQGGPQSAVSQFFSYRWNFQMMAANDYIIVAPNRRGLPSFGQEWNDQISKDYGGQNMKDYLSAIDALKQEPFVDENRLGAVGASYGGFSVFWLAGNHEKRFKAFIAHCGMFNLESWYGSTEELFFANHDIGGAYWENPKPKSYEFSPHRFIGNWDTPILVIHGEKDFRIPYTQGMEAFNAAQLKGIPSRFLSFPDENHWVLQPQNSILWQREFYRWLDHWLK